MKNIKLIYVSLCFVLSIFLSGCKEKEKLATVFDNLPESNYVQEAKTSLEDKKPLVIGFIAEWCPHCRKYKPVLNEVKEEYKDSVTFIQIDVDDSNGSTLSNRFQVKGIPTTAFVRKDGSVFKVQVGGIEKDALSEIVEELIASKNKKSGEPIAPFPIEPEVAKPEEPKEEAPPQELIKEEEAPAEPQEEGKPEAGSPPETIEDVPGEAEEAEEDAQEESLEEPVEENSVE